MPSTTTDAACTRVGPDGRVLVVEPKRADRDVLIRFLRAAGYRTDEAGSATAAVEALQTGRYDVVIIDITASESNGIDVVRSLRHIQPTAMIVLSPIETERDRSRLRRLVVDDFVVKPFSPKEVVARVDAVVRRVRADCDSAIVRFGDVEVDLTAMTVRRHGELIPMARREFELLAYLIRHAGIPISRSQLLDAVWDSSPEWQDPATITVHIGRLRRKLEPDPNHPVHFVTVFGVGYRFDM